MRNPLEPLGVVLFVGVWLALPLAVLALLPDLFYILVVVLAILALLFVIALALHLLMRLPAWIGTAIEYVNYKRKGRAHVDLH